MKEGRVLEGDDLLGRQPLGFETDDGYLVSAGDFDQIAIDRTIDRDERYGIR